MSMVSLYDWCYVFMCMYTYIPQSCGISVCLYDWDTMSLTFVFGCACILIFPEVLGYLYACITQL
jgi:hypothetical protein